MRFCFNPSIFGAAVCAAAFLSVIPAAGQTAAGRIPRMSDGKPNLTGLWQAMGTADWDIEDHSAAAGPFYQDWARWARLLRGRESSKAAKSRINPRRSIKKRKTSPTGSRTIRK